MNNNKIINYQNLTEIIDSNIEENKNKSLKSKKRKFRYNFFVLNN